MRFLNSLISMVFLADYFMFFTKQNFSLAVRFRFALHILLSLGSGRAGRFLPSKNPANFPTLRNPLRGRGIPPFYRVFGYYFLSAPRQILPGKACRAFCL